MNFKEAAERVSKFNKMIGSKFPDLETIKLQTKLGVEEAEEGYVAAVENNPQEILDGALDVFVINTRLLEMLEQAGYDVEGAIKAVCDNNDTKVFTSKEEAQKECDKKIEQDRVDYYVDCAVVDGKSYYSIKRPDGKVVKKVGFKGVDLTPFIPKVV